MVSLIYLGKENPISYKTVFGMDAFDRHDTNGGNQTADSASDIKVYPESASGCLINDLGKLLNMNPYFCISIDDGSAALDRLRLPSG